MPSPEIWGPPIWTLFHVLIESIKEETFNTSMPQLVGFIKRICSDLPCPECSQHATKILAKLSLQELSNKEVLKNTFYIFHNMVNVKKNKPLFNYGNINRYRTIPLNIAFNNFVNVYNTKGNMRMLTESFRRKLTIQDFKKWLLRNSHFFAV